MKYYSVKPEEITLTPAEAFKLYSVRDTMTITYNQILSTFYYHKYYKFNVN